MRRAAGWLLLGAAALFLANPGGTSLAPLDDCFYAEKGAEMLRQPGMTVRWAESPAFQNPPGHFWILAASYRVLGVNDAAARIPTALMAIGALAGIAWIGARLLSPGAGSAGAALLVICPYFLNQGRRVMLDLPLLFWMVMAMAALVAWRERRAAIFLFAPALGMAILTKSVLGLLPLGVAIAAGVLSPAWRPLLRDPRFGVAAIIGIAIGASWPAHQWMTYGHEFVDVHFVREIAGRSLESKPWTARLLGYPGILATHFAPAVLAAVPAVWAGLRAWRERRSDPAVLLLVWGTLPLLLYSFSSAQSARYVFPLVPALALLGGAWLARRWPRATEVSTRRIVPVFLLAGALVFTFRPEWLTRDADAPYRAAAAGLSTRAPRGTAVAFLGGDYWRHANPLQWYAGLRLEPASASAGGAVALARSDSRLLLVERSRAGEVPDSLVTRTWIETRDATLLELSNAP